MDKSIEWSMKTREEILAYGLSFPDTYQEAPFHDQNWQLVRIRESKKAFLWTYMREGFLNLKKQTHSGETSGGVPILQSFRGIIRIRSTGIP